MMETGIITQIQIGMPKKYGSKNASNPFDRPWESGVFKEKIVGPVWVSKTNLSGDGQADLVHHGGKEKAVFAFAKMHYPYFQEKLQKRKLPYGAFGENLTIENLNEKTVCIGDTVEIGEVILQVAQPRQPCWKMARRWRIKDLALQLQQTGFTGWYYRVLKEGFIEQGQQMILKDRPFPEWSLARCNEVMHVDQENFEAAAELASCPYLAESWKKTLTQRIESKQVKDSRFRLYGNLGAEL